MENRLISFSVKEIIHSLVWYKRHLTGHDDVREISAIKYFLEDDSICFDVGAHAGFWTKSLSKLVPEGHVYAFEALPYYSHVLRIVIKMLRMANVTVINKAVFDKSDNISLAWKNQDGKRLTGRTHIAGKQDKNMRCVVVEAITLDSLLPIIPAGSRVSFIKIDIEGCELMAVRGAVKLIETFRPTFYLEITTEYCQRYDYMPADLFRFFEGFDYKAHTISLSNKEPELKATTSASYQGNGDVLFVPSEHVFNKS